LSHPSEDDLILYYYGEGDCAAVQAHLAGCPPCRDALAALRADLGRVGEEPLPERGAGHGAQVWRALEPRLGLALRRSPVRRPLTRFWAPAALAASLVVAFFLGRHFPAAGPAAGSIPEQGRDRIFLVMVGDHLERTEMVLLEVVNAEGPGAVDVRAARDSAESLVAANRLFRMNAAHAGEPGVASVLDEIERVLLEVAHAPARLDPEARAQIRRRLESGDILFKVRVLESTIRSREKQMSAVPGTAS
jgi:hypothetical protein